MKKLVASLLSLVMLLMPIISLADTPDAMIRDAINDNKTVTTTIKVHANDAMVGSEVGSLLDNITLKRIENKTDSKNTILLNDEEKFSISTEQKDGVLYLNSKIFGDRTLAIGPEDILHIIDLALEQDNMSMPDRVRELIKSAARGELDLEGFQEDIGKFQQLIEKFASKIELVDTAVEFDESTIEYEHDKLTKMYRLYVTSDDILNTITEVFGNQLDGKIADALKKAPFDYINIDIYTDDNANIGLVEWIVMPTAEMEDDFYLSGIYTCHTENDNEKKHSAFMTSHAILDSGAMLSTDLDYANGLPESAAHIEENDDPNLGKSSVYIDISMELKTRSDVITSFYMTELFYEGISEYDAMLTASYKNDFQEGENKYAGTKDFLVTMYSGETDSEFAVKVEQKASNKDKLEVKETYTGSIDGEELLALVRYVTESDELPVFEIKEPLHFAGMELSEIGEWLNGVGTRLVSVLSSLAGDSSTPTD